MFLSRQPRAWPGQGSDRFRTSSTGSPGVRESSDVRFFDFAADHQVRHLPRRDFIAIDCLHQPAVAQHGDSIGEVEHFVHLVRDVEDRHAALAQPVA